MIITIDGFSSQGKSTVAKLLAARLGFDFFSIGSLFRFMASDFVRLQIKGSDPEACAKIAAERLAASSIEEILAANEGRKRVSEEALQALVLHRFVYEAAAEKARSYAEHKDLVIDGRFGFLLFPDAVRRYYVFSSFERRCRLSAKSRGFTEEEAAAYIRYRDSLEIRYDIPEGVVTLSLDRFSSAEEIVAYLQSDLSNARLIV